jgi:aldehyde dehydrogenase (NAD+)
VTVQTSDGLTLVRPDAGAHMRTKLFIDGGWRDPDGPGRMAVHDAATGAVLGSVPAATLDDLDVAIGAAQRAQPDWAARPTAERAQRLRLVHAALQARRKELTEIIAAEVGTAARMCLAIQVDSALHLLAEAADVTESLAGEERMGNSVVTATPIGTVAAITPWNYPLFQTMGKVAAALAAGCTTVHKPSELAPLSAFILAEAIETAGLPAGVYNLVTGDPVSLGEALVTDVRIDMVSFTGSTQTGTRVYQLAAGSVKRVALEMGGKSASVLLDDADLGLGVKATVNRAFLNSGQTCDAWTRLIVPVAAQEEVVGLIGASIDRLTLGDPFDPATRLGPLVSARQAQRVRGYITEALAAGAVAAYGGAEEPLGLADGNYVQPTVLTGVTPDMAVAREEVFGPVLVVLAYDTEDEAIALANGTDYGLSGAVWSADVDRALAFARRMRAGQVVVNGGPYNPAAPFGGVKRSGIGRELGRYGVEEYLEPVAYQLPATAAEGR